MINKYSLHKKEEYWCHWVERVFVQGIKMNGVTGTKLRRIKPDIFSDEDFWADILDRHGGLYCTPLAMMINSRANYDHMIGNFDGMIYQTLVETGLVK